MKMKKLERLIKRIQMQLGIKGLKHYKRPGINKDRKMCVIDVESKDTLEQNVQKFSVQDVENLPIVSIKDTMKYVPGYEEKLYNIVQKHESGVNFLEKIGEEKFNPIT